VCDRRTQTAPKEDDAFPVPPPEFAVTVQQRNASALAVGDSGTSNSNSDNKNSNDAPGGGGTVLPPTASPSRAQSVPSRSVPVSTPSPPPASAAVLPSVKPAVDTPATSATTTSARCVGACEVSCPHLHADPPSPPTISWRASTRSSRRRALRAPALLARV
jgi:hypothetical protein